MMNKLSIWKNNLSNIWKKWENLITLTEYIYTVNWFTVPEFIAIWKEDFYKKLPDILNKFKWKKVALRSSSFTEDTDKDSKAGAFKTILNIEVKKENLIKAYESIQNHAKNKFWYYIPVVVQEMVENIKYAWVVFSKDPDIQKDYIIINYHSWIWEALVNWNISWKTIKFFSGFIPNKGVFSKLAKIVKEIKELYWQEVDIEFVIDDNNNIYLLQLRPITTIKWIWKTDKLSQRYASFLQTIIEKRNLVLGDMIDVNPEELIWSQPYLIKTFFDWLFVKWVLKDSRKDFWYSYEEFWLFVLDKYYVDLEKNIISFLPNTLSYQERKYFVEFYKNLLSKDISLQKQLDSKLYPININRVKEIVDLFSISEIKKKQTIKKFELFFSELDKKLANLANSYIKNEKNILNKIWVNNYYELIQLEDINVSLSVLLDFIKETARYFVDYARGAFYFSSLEKSNSSYFKSNHYFSSIVNNSDKNIIRFNNVEWFNFLKIMEQEINIDLLKKEWYGKKFYGNYSNLDVCLIGRENFKFIFMNLFRILSKKIKKFDWIEYVNFEDLINGKNSRIEHNRKKARLRKNFLLSPVIFTENTPSYITKFDRIWFFIGKWIVEWNIYYITDLSNVNLPEITWKILLLENATPEIDVFLPYIKGIITKNWWPLAHIAIRARELNIPAVVWVGDLFDLLKIKKKARIDFFSGKINIL